MPLPALNVPLPWKSDDPIIGALLDDLQANILKGHGRHTTINLFLKFDPTKAAGIRAAIHQLSGQLKSAKQQLSEAAAFKKTKKDGGTLRCFFLTFAGYEALGVANKAPAGPAFQAGMKARADLKDNHKTWDTYFKGTIHAMLLLADNNRSRLDADRASVMTSLEAAGVTLLGEERGNQQFNSRGDGVEHFGYVDGRSQPLLLAEDVENEKQTGGGSSMWNPAFPANQVLVTAANRVLGSFFVFRKLEQNVRAFNEAEDKLAESLDFKDEDKELAGAMMVGRFEDGTPVVLRKRDGFGGDPMNNFNYADDPRGSKCPLHAHIRKTNPRGSGDEPEWTERTHIMARRGITYGLREDGMGDRPEGGVGLLFMSYQTHIENQFEVTQIKWADDPNFPPHDSLPAPGRDPVISAAAVKGPQHCPVQWGDPDAKRMPENFGGFVTVKGGEYFFAPVIGDLRTL